MGAGIKNWIAYRKRKYLCQLGPTELPLSRIRRIWLQIPCPLNIWSDFSKSPFFAGQAFYNQRDNAISSIFLSTISISEKTVFADNRVTGDLRCLWQSIPPAPAPFPQALLIFLWALCSPTVVSGHERSLPSFRRFWRYFYGNRAGIQFSDGGKRKKPSHRQHWTNGRTLHSLAWVVLNLCNGFLKKKPMTSATDRRRT